LDHHLDRLVEDHANARIIADRLAGNPAVVLDPDTVRSNIVVFGLTAAAVDANTLVSRAREAGVLVVAFGARTVRAVTHLDVTREECVRAADILADAVN
jgi:threonine aldolase